MKKTEKHETTQKQFYVTAPLPFFYHFWGCLETKKVAKREPEIVKNKAELPATFPGAFPHQSGNIFHDSWSQWISGNTVFT